MPRIKLIELNQYRFTHKQKISISHLNFGGHVGNAQMAELIHDGRYQALKSIGLSEKNIGDDKTGIIMSDLIINFKQELFIDDNIIIQTDIDEIIEKGFRIFHRILKNDQTAVIAETGFVTFNYVERKICSVPKIFIEKLGKVK